MVLTWSFIIYTINITLVLKILTLNCLIPPTNAELMRKIQRAMEGDIYKCIKDLPKKYIILTNYMLSEWRIQLIIGLGKYVI